MAKAPATCGHAIEVPDIVWLPWSFVLMAASVPTPGAKMSILEPKFEKEARTSLTSEAPTVKESGQEAGEKLAASESELPAATTTGMPAALAAAMETPELEEEAHEPGPPRDIEMTQRSGQSATAQLMPAIIPEFEPEPPSERTLTPTTDDCFETP